MMEFCTFLRYVLLTLGLEPRFVVEGIYLFSCRMFMNLFSLPPLLPFLFLICRKMHTPLL